MKSDLIVVGAGAAGLMAAGAEVEACCCSSAMRARRAR